MLTCAQDRTFHPVQQYLRSVNWDGVGRLSSMARDYFASGSPLHATLIRKWMISAVARALQPGCKVDTTLMLCGPQGYFKSSFFAIWAMRWHVVARSISPTRMAISRSSSGSTSSASWRTS